MRTGKFSKAQYRIAHAFSKDSNGLKKLPSLKAINAELDRRMEGIVSTHEDYWLHKKPSAKELENMQALLEVGSFKKIDGVFHKKSTLTLVSDLEMLYRRVTVARSLTDEVGVVFKMDDGRDSFKICWQIQVVPKFGLSPANSGKPYAVPTEPELELEDAFDFLNGLLDEQSDIPEDAVEDLNSSFAENALEDDDEVACHLGENTDILSTEYDIENQNNYDISRDFEKTLFRPIYLRNSNRVKVEK